MRILATDLRRGFAARCLAGLCSLYPPTALGCAVAHPIDINAQVMAYGTREYICTTLSRLRETAWRGWGISFFGFFVISSRDPHIIRKLYVMVDVARYWSLQCVSWEGLVYKARMESVCEYFVVTRLIRYYCGCRYLGWIIVVKW